MVNREQRIAFRDWFDLSQKSHLIAFQHLRATGLWPRGFLPVNVLMEPLWYTFAAETYIKALEKELALLRSEQAPAATQPANEVAQKDQPDTELSHHLLRFSNTMIHGMRLMQSAVTRMTAQEKEIADLKHKDAPAATELSKRLRDECCNLGQYGDCPGPNDK